MSKKCYVCGKHSHIGNTVSHSNHHTKRVWNANLQKINIMALGKKIKEFVCTKCLKAGKVAKAV